MERLACCPSAWCSQWQFFRGSGSPDAINREEAMAFKEGELDLRDAHDAANGQARKRVPAAVAHFEALDMYPDYKLYDISMYDGDGGFMREPLKHYYDCCIDSSITSRLIVTTSCFSVWRKAKKTNGAAKVVPAVPAAVSLNGGEPIRVFFFDDNINLHLGGSSDAEGICNLRDIYTGEFVDFSIGKNGFAAERFFKHTFVHASTEYRVVLVQANILDAMAHLDYFQAIISRYAQPGERLIVFSDVNGTIVWDDTVRGKDMSEVLLSTMFRFAEIRPRAADGPLDFVWQDKPAISVAKPEDLRGLINRISNKDNDFYQAFWTLQTCEKFVNTVASVADLAWHKEEGTIDPAQFFNEYRGNLDEIRRSSMKDGIPQSWLRCFTQLVQEGHSVILNSFGVDTHRVIAQVVNDKKDILQLTINYNMWGEKDLSSWNKQFES